MNSDSTKSISAFIRYAPILVVITTTALWAFGALATHRGWLCSLINFGSLDHLEDTFAPVNVYFTGVSGLGIIATLIFQRFQITQANKDAAENVKMLEKQIHESRTRFTLEHFGSIFFNLLTIHIQNSRRIHDIPEQTIVRDTFGTLEYANFRDIIEITRYTSNNPLILDLSQRDNFLNAYRIPKEWAETKFKKYHFDHYYSKNDPTILPFLVLFEKFGNIYQTYYRHLYHLIKFTDKQLYNDIENRKLYMGIIRAQFARHEHIALFYNAIYFADSDEKQARDKPNTKFKELIERNHLLHEIETSLLIRPEHYNYYEKRAYGDGIDTNQTKNTH